VKKFSLVRGDKMTRELWIVYVLMVLAVILAAAFPSVKASGAATITCIFQSKSRFGILAGVFLSHP